MENTGFESYVNCPECKAQIKINLNSMEGDLMEFARGISRGLGLGIENSDRFLGNEKCECGKSVTVSMTVTAT